MCKFENVNELAKNLIVPSVATSCFCVGLIVKYSLDFIDNNKIPLIVGAFGIFFNVWLNDWKLTPKILSEGLISGWASTGLFEVLKNQGIL